VVQNADNFAYCGRIAVEMTLKPGVADDGHRSGAGGAVVGFGESAAEGGRDTQDGEVVAGDQIDAEQFERRAGDGSVGAELDAAHGGDAGKGLGPAFEFAIEGVGEERPALVGQSVGAAHRSAVAEEDKLLRILDGQRAEHDGVEQGEDGGVGADAEGERKQGHEGEAGALGEGAAAEAQVGEEVVEARLPARGPDLVFYGVAAADFDPGEATGGFGVEAGLLFVGG